MRLSRWLCASGFMVLALLAACSSSSDNGASDSDGGGAGSCCPTSGPACCMSYGGWSDNGQCEQVCDGIPDPSDPGWKSSTDDHGCVVWSNTSAFGSAHLCGEPEPVVDSGADAGSEGDGGLDAQTD